MEWEIRAYAFAHGISFDEAVSELAAEVIAFLEEVGQ